MPSTSAIPAQVGRCTTTLGTGPWALGVLMDRYSTLGIGYVYVYRQDGREKGGRHGEPRGVLGWERGDESKSGLGGFFPPTRQKRHSVA